MASCRDNRMAGTRGARRCMWPLGCALWLLCAWGSAASAQAIQADAHLVYCANKQGEPSYVLGVKGVGMPSSLPLQSNDSGATVFVDDGNGNRATLSCETGCVQSHGQAFCVPQRVAFPPVNFAVLCPSGAREGQVWSSTQSASSGADCTATVSNGLASGWVCETYGDSGASHAAFDCDTGCTVPGACQCVGGKCPPPE